MTAIAPPLLQIKRANIAPQIDADILLRDLSLTLERGQTIAICAPSGSGKTSLLKAIAGELVPSGGTILLDGFSTHKLSAKQRARIGFISQSHDLVEQLRVDRNVMAGALGRWSNWRALRFLIRPNLAEEAEAEGALAAVGLSGMGRRATSTLSGGERQRLAIARMLIQAPDLLLADEPIASLDPVNARAILELLTSLARERNMALVCSLHQPDLAKTYFDRVITLRDGAIEEAD